MYLKRVFALFLLFVAVNGLIHSRYSGILTDYEVVLPRKVRSNGAFFSFDLIHQFEQSLLRTKRCARDKEVVYYSLRVGGVDEQVVLAPNPDFLSPGMLVEDRRGSNLTHRELRAPSRHLCHFSGHLRGIPGSRAALSLCSGMVGLVKKNGTMYLVEPLENAALDGAQLHLVHKKPTTSNGCRSSCESSRDWWNSWAQEIYRTVKVATKENRRMRRFDSYTNVPRYIELCVVSDLKFILYHKTRDVEEYVLSIMNMVADFYHDDSIGTMVDVVVVRLVFLHKEKEELDLDISTEAKSTLESFCQWQTSLNPKDPNHPNHHDVAVLLTRHNLCSEGKAASGLLGLAYVGTVCNPDKSCCINEDTGLMLALTVAHELGHTMGCAHDDPEESGCAAKLLNGASTIMSPSVGAVWSTAWSTCSKQFIATLMGSRLGECLLDEPTGHNYVSSEVPIGQLYDADMQCKLVFGDDYVKCNIGGEKVCEELWCKLIGSKRCLSRGQIVADGTPCGPELWCFNKQCVTVGTRLTAVDGGWSEWGNWTECTRTCGGGISMRERLCSCPQPKNGGRYCSGKNKEYNICNKDDCEEGQPNFREFQCRKHNLIPFRGELHTWKPFIAPESEPNPCVLYCINEKRILVKLEPRVKDGTRCHPGSKDTCISGSCISVGCDWVIGSNSVEDVCGKCNGDGTMCKIIEELFLLTDGSGYFKVATIPRASTNIVIVEIQRSENMISIGSPNGSIYLNGNFTEKLPGQYKIGGVLGIYSKPEKGREEIHIKGPLKEEIVLFYVFFKSENPGIRYRYAVPTSEQTYPPKYHWEYAEWGECSARCGVGTQVSRPTCVEMRAGKVSPEYCDPIKKPEPKTKVCSREKCRTMWKTGAWGACSGCMYRAGERRRVVECIMELPSHSGADEVVVGEEECIGPKPVSVELCSSSRSCSLVTCAKGSQPFDRDFVQYSNNLAGLKESIRDICRRDISSHPSFFANSSENHIILDKLNPDDFLLKVVDVLECSNDLLSNMSEADFESVGGRVLHLSVAKTNVLKGGDAMRMFHDATKEKMKNLNIEYISPDSEILATLSSTTTSHNATSTCPTFENANK